MPWPTSARHPPPRLVRPLTRSLQGPQLAHQPAGGGPGRALRLPHLGGGPRGWAGVLLAWGTPQCSRLAHSGTKPARCCTHPACPLHCPCSPHQSPPRASASPPSAGWRPRRRLRWARCPTAATARSCARASPATPSSTPPRCAGGREGAAAWPWPAVAGAAAETPAATARAPALHRDECPTPSKPASPLPPRRATRRWRRWWRGCAATTRRPSRAST